MIRGVLVIETDSWAISCPGGGGDGEIDRQEGKNFFYAGMKREIDNDNMIETNCRSWSLQERLGDV